MYSDVRAVLFDAVGTLMRPDPPVAVAYQMAARRFGSRLSQQEIAERFAVAFQAQEEADRQLRNEAALSRRATDEQRERLRWQRIVLDVFYDVGDAGGPLFDALWNHFAQSRHWAPYDDVADAWRELQQRGFTLGIASNFDQRLLNICRELQPLAGCQNIFWSANIGYPKPSPEFFRAVAQRLELSAEQILLVGDSRENDFLGAQAAGWHALLLDRASDNAYDGAIPSLKSLTRLLAR